MFWKDREKRIHFAETATIIISLLSLIISCIAISAK